MKKNTILLVEENLWDAGLVEEALAEMEETQHLRVASRSFQLVHVQAMQDALDVLSEIPVDLVLLDLNLPDSKALHSLFRLQSHAPHIPVVVLCDRPDEPLAVSSVREGALDYLIKDEVDCVPLARCLHTAIERHQSQTVLLRHSSSDALTGVFTSGAFGLLANQSLRFAARLNLAVMVAVAELDQRSGEGDAFSRQARDSSLLHTADVLRASFDSSAVIARLSDFRFGVVALFANRAEAAVMSEHVSAAVDDYNRNPRRLSPALIKLGLYVADPGFEVSEETDIAALLVTAANSMVGGEQSALATA